MKKTFCIAFITFSTVTFAQPIKWNLLSEGHWTSSFASNSDQTKLYKSCLNDYGVMLSLNSGNTWTPICLSPSGASSLIIKNDTLVVLFDECGYYPISGLHYSVDDGQTWVSLGSGYNAHTITSNQSTIYLVSNYQIRYTSNWGTTWQSYSMPINTGTGSGFYSIAIDGNSIVIGSTNAVYISHDNGVTWNMKPTGIEGKSFAVYISGDTIFASRNGLNRGLIKSFDGGNTWIQQSDFSELGVFSIKFFDNTGFVTTDSWYGPQVYMTHDMGNTWNLSMNGIVYNSRIRAFHQIGDNILCGGDEYIYRGTWVDNVNTAEAVIDPPKVYPNPFDSEIRLMCAETGKLMEITLYDLQGKKIMNKTILCNDEIPVEKLDPGLYLMNIKNESWEHNIKILKAFQR